MNGQDHEVDAVGKGHQDEEDADGVEEAIALVGRRTREEPASAACSGAPGSDATDSGNPASGTPFPGAPRPGPARTEATRHRATSWPDARALAARIGRATPPRTRRVPLDQALGQSLAEPLTALCDLPSFDTSAMDGWVVAGPGPWSVQGEGSILAGHGETPPLPDGAAVRIATGARVPPEATAVIRSEHSRTAADKSRLYAEREVIPGQDIRPRGQECRSGDQLLPATCLVTPAVLGLAAAAGYDELLTVARPRVEVLVLGDELLTAGLPHEGLIRDALGPMIGPWLRALGADVMETRRLGDDADALHHALATSDADLLITTGGTAAGPVDHVHPVLRKAGAELLVDGVAVRPGHPMLLAALAPSGDLPARHLVGLPGNPLAAVSGLLTLAEPLLRELAGKQNPLPYHLPVRDEVHGHPYDTRLVPIVHRDDRIVPLHYNGPAMLRGIAAADGLAVVPPGGARAGAVLEVIDLPWTPWSPSGDEGGCFT
ncbi:molybdopterin-binding protein [Streptomyces sp. NBC_01142]|uniref:molybdopterin molybdotransferase MoeA n=1 Tax=Streptomyces sp. NBC_01142 TaxID=2975865 RepID=UPI00224FBFCC|nr:molybdopterin-binding protein [Streptomyces sp. NBC_01142]MCX4824454.1 molybdopterin-binding protein [Streptomyces sp. NBC_01142]